MFGKRLGRRRLTPAPGVALLIAVCGFLPHLGAQAADPIPAVLPSVPDGAKEPQVTVGRSGDVFLTYGAGNSIYCAASHDSGKTYAPPVLVSASGTLSLGMRRGPRVAVAGKEIVVTAVSGRIGKGRDGDLLAWRSGDGGKTWQGPATVNDIPGAAREGLHAMTAAQDGTLACVWLDLREPGTRICAALSHDGGATWGKNVLVYRSPDGHVCECCHPCVASGKDGALYVMFRNWLGGSRDLFLVRSNDGGKTFGTATKLGAGTWPLDACPMDGGGLSISPTGSIATVWRRQDDLYTCVPGEAERHIARGQQGANAYGPGGLYDVWIQGRPGLLFAQLPGSTAPTQLAVNADDPVIACAHEGTGPVVIAWTEVAAGKTTIRSIVLAPQ